MWPSPTHFQAYTWHSVFQWGCACHSKISTPSSYFIPHLLVLFFWSIVFTSNISGGLRDLGLITEKDMIDHKRLLHTTSFIWSTCWEVPHNRSPSKSCRSGVTIRRGTVQGNWRERSIGKGAYESRWWEGNLWVREFYSSLRPYNYRK